MACAEGKERLWVTFQGRWLPGGGNKLDSFRHPIIGHLDFKKGWNKLCELNALVPNSHELAVTVSRGSSGLR
jgi:hypothetical protein